MYLGSSFCQSDIVYSESPDRITTRNLLVGTDSIGVPLLVEQCVSQAIR